MQTTLRNISFSSSHHRSKVWGLNKVAAMLSTPEGRVGARWGRGWQGNMGRPCSNPIPVGRAAAACAAFHNSGGFWVGREGERAAFLHGRGHQRRRATSKATQSLGVDDCNPPLSPLLATSAPQPSNTRTHTERADCARYVHPPASVLPARALAVLQQH